MLDLIFEQLRGAHVLAIKGTMFDIRWADAGFGLDMPRYTEWRDRIASLPGRIYWAVPEEWLPRTGPPPSKNVTFLKRLAGEQLSEDPGEIYGGGTSGFGALQICIHKRAKKIVLFGFDYDGAYDAHVGFRHNDAHYNKKRDQLEANWERWATHFDIYPSYFNKHGISVANACPKSAIRCFQKVTLEDGVAMLRRGVNGG